MPEPEKGFKPLGGGLDFRVKPVTFNKMSPCRSGGMAYTLDLKSSPCKGLRVRVPPPVPLLRGGRIFPRRAMFSAVGSISAPRATPSRRATSVTLAGQGPEQIFFILPLEPVEVFKITSGGSPPSVTQAGQGPEQMFLSCPSSLSRFLNYP